MDPEEERIKLLTRLGRETIIKYGTYEMDKAKLIYQDHPFYAKPEPVSEPEPEQPESNYVQSDAFNTPEPIPAAPVSDDEAAAMAAQITGSNFKAGLSQEEVDAILNGLL